MAYVHRRVVIALKGNVNLSPSVLVNVWNLSSSVIEGLKFIALHFNIITHHYIK